MSEQKESLPRGHNYNLSHNPDKLPTFSTIILSTHSNTFKKQHSTAQTHTDMLASSPDTLSLLVPNSQIP